MSNKKFNFFQLLLILILILNITCYIKFKLRKSFENELQLIDNKFNISNLIKRKFENIIKTSINIGTPPQQINLYLLMNESLFIFNKVSQKDPIQLNSYIPSKSNSYKFNLNYTFLNNSVPAKDIILFDFYTFLNKTEMKKEIEFYINEDINDKNLVGILGLGLEYIEDDEKKIQKIPSFISQLKMHGLISNYRWFINFGNEQNELIIGLSPHEYDKNNFDENILVNFPARPFKSRITKKIIFNWNFRISKMYVEFGNNKTTLDLTSEMSIDLDYNSELIVSIQKYWAYIRDTLYKDYLKDKKCFVNKLNYSIINEKGGKSQYYYFYCNYEYKDEIRNNFRNIVIECQECNYTFVLTFDDIVKDIKIVNNEGKEEKKLLFLIVSAVNNYAIHSYHRWIMGEPFLRKYQFFFEENSKMIYFYKKENTNNNNNKKEKSIINNDSFKFNNGILIIIILSMFWLFIIIIKKKTYKNKKKEKDKNSKNGLELDDYKELIKND